VNRKQWMIVGILITVLFVAGFVALRGKRSNSSVEPGTVVPAFPLTYCGEEQDHPCIVSFGLDVDGNMLVNILLPEISFPNFYLRINRGESVLDYRCRRVTTAPLGAYCIGEKLPPGELLHVMLLAVRNDAVLAEGDLSIIGLALPTLAVVTPTIEESTPPDITATSLTEERPTEFPEPSPTPFQKPLPATSTPTPLSYPNPTSYPNPSYP